jgi:hypothetical protein
MPEVRQAYVSPAVLDGGATYGIIKEILRLMVSTGYGVNGSYDQLPPGYGLGIPAALVDVESFEAAQSALSQSLLTRHWIVSEASSLLETPIEPEARSCGFQVVLDNGRIACRLMQASVAPGAVSLTESNKGEPGDRAVFRVDAANIIQGFTLKAEWDIVDERFRTTVNSADEAVLRRYNSARIEEVENKGAKEAAGTDIAELGFRMQLRAALYGEEHPIVARTTSHLLFTRVVPADFIPITDSGIIDPETGEFGVTLRPGTVLRSSFDLLTGKGRIEMMIEGHEPQSRLAPLAPSAEMVAWDSGTRYATFHANSFTDSTGALADVADYFEIGDEVQIVEADDTDPATATTAILGIVSFPAANQVELDGATNFTPTTVPTYMQLGPTSQNVGEESRATWQADPDDNLINDDHAARKWR